MKFCCGLVLYYPEKKYIENIALYSGIFEKVYVFDNTEDVSLIKQYQNYVLSFKNIEYISYGNNVGLSKAYNVMCSKAITENFDYICILDQDSIINKKSFLEIINNIINYPNNNVAVFAPRVLYTHKMNNCNKISSRYESVKWVISSGSFLNLHAYKNIGSFDENLFIDRIDYDYCSRARRKKYKIIRINTALLIQNLGVIKDSLIKKSNHSVLRHYYIFRNRFYYYLYKQKSIISSILCIILTIKHVFLILFYESEKIEKIGVLFKAFNDFSCNNLGKIKYDTRENI